MLACCAVAFAGLLQLWLILSASHANDASFPALVCYHLRTKGAQAEKQAFVPICLLQPKSCSKSPRRHNKLLCPCRCNFIYYLDTCEEEQLRNEPSRLFVTWARQDRRKPTPRFGKQTHQHTKHRRTQVSNSFAYLTITSLCNILRHGYEC